MRPGGGAVLELDNVIVRFGGVTAVAGVSLQINDNEVLGLVGPNGAGKTTLFNVISGLIRPTSGRILFNGDDLSRLPAHRRARAGIGRTFQIPQPLEQLTVLENLLVAARFGARDGVNRERIERILETVGLSGRMQADAATALTLTERKALEVAKALATDPRLLLLDEVLAGLETQGKRAFVTTLDRARSEFGYATVIIEHDIETISSLCDRVVVLDFGQVIADDTPERVFNDPRVIRSYTGEATT